jgi:hypothetical protein
MKQFADLDHSDSKIIVIQTSNPIFNIACMALVGGISLPFAMLSQRQTKRQMADMSAAMLPAKLDTKKQLLLHDILDDYFTEQELRDLCFKLAIDYEDLPYSGQTYKARELVSLCARMGQMAKLTTAIQEKRPHLFSEKPSLVAHLPGLVKSRYAKMNKTVSA